MTLSSHGPSADSMPRKAGPTFVLSGLLLAAALWILLQIIPATPQGESIRRITADIGWLLLALALLIAGCACWPMMIGHRLSRHARRRLEALGVLLLLLGGAVLFLRQVLSTKTASIAGQRFFWLDDDMMISLRFARHLAEGHGLVWNIDDPPVEGFTNLLWTLLMALTHLILTPNLAAGGVLALSGALLLAVYLLSWRVGRRLGLDPAERLLALLCIVSNRWLMYWTAAGSEAVLLAALILLAALLLLKARRRRPLNWRYGCLLGILALVRADAPVIVGAFLLVWWSLVPARRARPWAWLPGVILPLGVLFWRYGYYGDWFPNTFYLRMDHVPSRPAMGVIYLFYFLSLAAGLVVFNVVQGAVARRPIGRRLVVVTLAALAYGAYAGGDELPEFRFFAPVVPLLILLAVAGASRTLRLATRSRWPAELRFGLLALLMALGGYQSLMLPNGYAELGQARGRMEADNVRLGLLLRAHTRPEAVIAHTWAGAAPYFSERPALDMLGKNDRHIARRPAARDDQQTAHNKYDAAYIFALRPDVVVSSIPGHLLLNREGFQNAPEREQYAGLFRVLEDDAFWRDYLPGLVQDPLSMNFHGVCVRLGSPLADPPDRWSAGDSHP